MSNAKEQSLSSLKQGFNFAEASSFSIGKGLLDSASLAEDLRVRIPFKTLNRHGLIAGATGTGKTKTLQLLAEKMSAAGIPVFMMDIKGDLSGIAKPGEENENVKVRSEKLGLKYEAKQFPVELLNLQKEKSAGISLKATISELGPILFSRIMDLNETQSGIVSVIFKYADDHKLPILNLPDFKSLIKFIEGEGKQEFEESYGKISSSSTGIIQRKLIELEGQGADLFFGEPSFDINDLMRQMVDGKGVISVMQLAAIQDRPKVFSTFVLSLLSEVYSTLPEVGDLERPKLVMFIDEAHLFFEGSSKALLEEMETVIRLIRSKGVGIFFCSQNPQDIPDKILGQLGLKIQHALRAFTAKDRNAIQKAVENYPPSELYDLETLITSLGIGEALVTALSEKGTPTPVLWTMLEPPASRMGILSPDEMNQVASSSSIKDKYNQELDSVSAHEILEKKINPGVQATATQPKPSTEVNKAAHESSLDKFLKDPLVRKTTQTAVRTATTAIVGTLARGLFGALTGKSSRRR
jgi:uncharacterized protein